MKMLDINEKTLDTRKACIVTFHNAYNFGAVLQTYALQTFIQKKFATVKVVDYHNEEMDASYSLPSWKTLRMNPKNAVFRIMQAVLYRGKKKKIDEFRNLLCVTKRYDAQNITYAKDEGDIFITGSDQVWNHLIIGCDSTYFLDFASDKIRCSYAASFGISSIPENLKKFYQNGIEQLDYLSVRENIGCKLIRELTDKDSCVVPDPTLLLDSLEWKKLCIYSTTPKKYILVYKITKADNLLGFAQNLAKETKLPIIYVPNDLKDGIVGSLRLNVGPREWMGLIDNAEYVVTNSFHGTVFSIIFGKKFFCEASKKINPSVSRLHSLLKTFGLENRLFEHYSKDMLEVELSKSEITKICNQQRVIAEQYLAEVFSVETRADC